MKYTVDYLYQEFSALAGMRKGNPAYANDSTYWDGGHCNWGGSHNLREDCAVIGRGFEKFESLKGENINNQLTQSISEQDFNLKKSNFIRKANELISQFQVRTGYSSSMFGICIIWADDSMSQHVESKLAEIRRELDQLKSQLGQESYQWVEELKRLELEIKQIENKMKENQLKAQRETDPIKKQALIAEIESDGKLLQQKYREHQQHSNKYRFDASKHIHDLVEKMKKAIEGKSGNNRNPRSGGSGSGGNRRNPTNPDPFGDPNNWPDPEPNTTPKRIPRSSSDQPQNNQLILIVAVVGVVIFFMMQKDKPVSHNTDYYDY